MTIEISVQSNVALKGLQFQLYHTPFTKVDTTLKTYTLSIPQIGEDKLFEDFTLHSRKSYDDELTGKLIVNFVNDVSTLLDFDSLNLFLANKEYILSQQYSQLIMNIDTTITNIHDEGIWLYVAQINSSEEDEILYSKTISNSIDIIELPIGQILRGYQNGSIGTYDGFKLMMGGSLYNYSILSIQDDARIDIMYTK